MNTRLIAARVFVSVLALVTGACTLPTSAPSPGFYVQVYDPASGAVVPVGTTLYVDADGQSTTTTVSRLDFYANGVWFGSSSGADLVPSSSGVDGEAEWHASEVGEFQLQASALRRGGLLISAPVRVCVVDFAVDPGNTFSTSYGYDGTCPIPDRDSAARPGPVTMTAAAAPSSFVYIPPGADGVIPAEMAGCSPSRTITFQATVVDPPEDVALVAVLISMPTGPGSSPAWGGRGAVTSTFILSETGTYPGSTRIFEGSAAPEPNPGFIFGDMGGAVTWTAEAISRDGSIIATDGPHEIPASPCGPEVPLSAPFTPAPAETTAPTETPAATSTWTPSPDNCPAGTYYAPNSNQCIAIQIIPTKPGPAPDCSAFGNKGNCRNNGCSWDSKAGVCH
jgi:hypothetical protein